MTALRTISTPFWSWPTHKQAVRTCFTPPGKPCSVDKKATKKDLTALAKKITTAAKAGDAAATTAGVKEFIAAEKLTELDRVKGNNWDPRQRRNPGAPPTSEIEAQMGTEAFALYAPTKSQLKDYGL